jgi:hypothetical protein
MKEKKEDNIFFFSYIILGGSYEFFR